MKLMWFHLMPYTELPDDFRQKHPSVWVDIHSSLFDPKRAHLMYNDFMDELEYAAECGFDAICVNEHHSNGYGLMPSPNLIASALARRTTDTTICVMGNSLALYNPPTRVAEEFAMIDCISGGRLIAGFPVGTPMDTCFAYGQNPSMLRERYLEAHDLVMKAWTREGDVRLQRPLQPAALRQHLAAAGAAAASAGLDPGRRLGRDLALVRGDGLRLLLPVLLRLQGRRGDHEGLLGRDGSARQGPQSVSRRLPAVRRRRRDRAEAMELYAEPAEYFYGRCLHVDPRFATPPGYITEATQRVGLESQIAQAAKAQPKATARTRSSGGTTGTTAGSRFNMVAREMADIVERGYVIVGSPKEVVEQLEHVAKTLNVGHLMMLLQYGNMSKELTKYNTKLFAEKVMPALSKLFPEWEDKWWPKPMAQSARATLPAFHPGTVAAAE